MAVDAFIKLGDIKGESSDSAHKGEIDILAWSWGMSQSGTTHSGTGGGAGKVNVQDLSFTHHVDTSTPVIMQNCCTGKHIPEATLTLRKAGDKPLDYMIIKLTDILVTSCSTGGSHGEERLTENVTLNFAKFEVNYQAQSKSGAKEGGPVKATFDIAANKV